MNIFRRFLKWYWRTNGSAYARAYNDGYDDVKARGEYIRNNSAYNSGFYAGHAAGMLASAKMWQTKQSMETHTARLSRGEGSSKLTLVKE